MTKRSEKDWEALALDAVEYAASLCILRSLEAGVPLHIGPDAVIPSAGCSVCACLWPFHKALMDAGRRTGWRLDD